MKHFLEKHGLWVLLAIAVVWVIRAIKSPKLPTYQRNNRFRY